MVKCHSTYYLGFYDEFISITHLITLTKRKNEILSYFCDKSTLFLCLCETFLHE